MLARIRDRSTISPGYSGGRRAQIRGSDALEPPGHGGRGPSTVARLPGRLLDRLGPVSVAGAAALMSLALGVYQITRPHVLFGELAGNLSYDQGVYFGAAVRLVHGVIPYRDFVYVHPPGIAVLMSPVALLGELVGTGAALAVAQCLTVSIIAANVFLAGYLVRSSGRVAVAVASVLLALWPFAVQVNGLVMLEPYLVFFSLLGAVLLCGGTTPATRRRVILAGACLGMALSMKMWGIFPVVAAILWCLPAWRRRLVPLLLGMGSVLVVVWAPFVVAAPGAFVHDVIVAQVARKPFIGIPETPLAAQLKAIIGFADSAGGPVITGSSSPMVAVYVLLAGMIGVLYGITWRSRTAPEWAVLLFSLTTFVGMTALPTPNYATHYAYFPAALLAPLVGVCVARSAVWMGQRIRHVVVGSLPLASALQAVVLVAAIVGIAMFIPKVTGVTDQVVSTAFDPRPAIQSTIPAGACALADYPVVLVVADRFSSHEPGCPVVVDPFGMYLTEDDGNQPYVASVDHPIPTAFTSMWAAWLAAADYVVLSVPYTDYIPWSQSLIQRFAHDFRLVDHASYPPSASGAPPSADLYIYRRVGD